MSTIRDIIKDHGGSFDGVKDKCSFLLPVEGHAQAEHDIVIASQRTIKFVRDVNGGWRLYRVVKTRKPYRIFRVRDRSASNNVNEHLIVRIDPTGVIEIREKGRKSGFQTTVAAVYIRCMLNEVFKRQMAKAKERKAKRKGARR